MDKGERVELETENQMQEILETVLEGMGLNNLFPESVELKLPARIAVEVALVGEEAKNLKLQQHYANLAKLFIMLQQAWADDRKEAAREKAELEEKLKKVETDRGNLIAFIKSMAKETQHIQELAQKKKAPKTVLLGGIKVISSRFREWADAFSPSSSHF